MVSSIKERIISSFPIAILFAILFFTSLIASSYITKESCEYNNYLYISEIMARNKTTVVDSDGDYSDYIEIYNPQEFDVNLNNYYLSDEKTSSKKWKFPDITIKSQEYLNIYASGKNKCDLESRECHTNFKLSSDGEIITLLNDDGLIISKIKYDKLSEDVSYSLIDGKYRLTIGTPNKENIYTDLDFNISDVIINEVAIGNTDSIELKNNSEYDIDLSDYYIQDKKGTKCELKDYKIAANSFLALYENNGENSPDRIYINCKINDSNEILYLYKKEKLIDTFNVGKLRYNTSKGINENKETVIFKNVTMGYANSDEYYVSFSLAPQFSINGGYVESGTVIKLYTTDNSEIYYTIDGSIPSKESTKYIDGITINKTTVIRAISYKDNCLESDIESRTFIVGREHDLPVISISSNNDLLYGTSGIFTKGDKAEYTYPFYGANFWNDIEVPISFEYYEGGKLGLSFSAGMKIFGGWSRGEAQKSVSISLRKKYGLQEITYPFFENNVNTFSKFILRSSGQDFGYLKLKDAFLQEVLDEQMDIDKQDYRPIVLYINGIYNGIYNIREKVDKTYVERHYGLDESEFDFIEGNNAVKVGSIDEYNSLLEYVKNNDMTTNEAYDYVDSQIDLQELANYWVVETFFDQFDPINIKFYKPKDGKWRWILFDLDQSFFTSTYKTIKWNLPFDSYAHGNSYYLNTTLMNRLIKNPKFKELYVKTFATHLKSTFNPDRMCEILDRMANEIKNEMPYHIERWYDESKKVGRNTIDNMDEWYSNISYFKKQIKTRYDIALNTIKEGLNLTDEEYQKYFEN